MRYNRHTEYTKLNFPVCLPCPLLPPNFFGNCSCQRNLSLALCQSSEPGCAVSLCLELGSKHSFHLFWGLWQIRDSSCCVPACVSANPVGTVPRALQARCSQLLEALGAQGLSTAEGAPSLQSGSAASTDPCQHLNSLFHTEAQSPQVNTEGFVTLKKPLLQSARGQT